MGIKELVDKQQREEEAARDAFTRQEEQHRKAQRAAAKAPETAWAGESGRRIDGQRVSELVKARYQRRGQK